MQQMKQSLSTFTERIEIALNANITANNYYPHSRSNSPPYYPNETISSDGIKLGSGSDQSD